VAEKNEEEEDKRKQEYNKKLLKSLERKTLKDTVSSLS
jgi:hypothetical protein